MPDFGSFRGFGEKLTQGQTPTQLGLLGSQNIDPLLLDLYTNASAAYSLRLLRAAYTGYAIKVRRASDNTEQDIGFVNGLLDTASLLSFCGIYSGYISTWYDQSGNGVNATQPTASDQPQIVLNGSILTLNNKYTLSFNAKCLTFTQIPCPTFSTFAVIKNYSVSGYSGYYLNSTASGTNKGFKITSANNGNPWVSSLLYYTGGTENMTYSRRNAVNSSSNQYIESWMGDGTTPSLYENLTAQTLATPPSGWGTGLTRIGPTHYSSGIPQGNFDIQELILYPNLQVSNQSDIVAKINSYYEIY